MTYILLYNMPGYLPEMEPYEIDGDLKTALEALRDEVCRMADEDLVVYDRNRETWNEIISAIDKLIESPTPNAGGYNVGMPNGYNISISPTEEESE